MPAPGPREAQPPASQALVRDDSRRVLETLLGNLPGMVYRCKNAPTWPFSFVSEGCRAITGWAPADFVERRVDYGELILAEDRARVWAEVQRALEERRPFVLDYRISTRGGQTRWVWERGCGVHDQQEDVAFLEGVIFDVSQEKELETQLLQSQRMEAVGRLAGGVAHDFNNLLTVILGYAEMLRAALPTDSPLRAHARQIDYAGRRAADLTRKLLSFARQQRVEPQVLDLGELLLSVDPLLRRLIGADVELVTLPGRDVGPVEADPGQLEQVLVNLAVNARQAMPRGGKLTLESAEVEPDQELRLHGGLEPGRHVQLTVSDTGTGMDADTLAHAFEPFFTTKPVGEGTGLGLATCYGIVKQAHGHIAVESEPGEGTVFRILLPRSSGSRRKLTADALVADVATGHETLLLVEDEDLVRRVAKEILSELGYRVLVARSGVEALELAGEDARSIDLLVTDLVMPQMSGGEVARRLRERRPDLRVLFMSGYSDEPRTQADALGRHAAFLGKPFTPRELARRVRDLLDRSSAWREGTGGD